MPPSKYQLVKARKVSRLCRLRRKTEQKSVNKQLEVLRGENTRLRSHVSYLQGLLEERERVLALERERSTQAVKAALASQLEEASPGRKPSHSPISAKDGLINELRRRGSVSSHILREQA